MVPTNFSLGRASFAVLLLMAALFCNARVLSCPEKCECGQQDTLSTAIYINCSNRDLTIVPVYSGPQNVTKVSVLNLRYNQIAEITAGHFQSYPQILSLHLGNNKLTSIPEAVSDLTSLRALFLQGNNFGDLTPEKAFTKLTRLQVLYLSDCRITSLPDNVFGGNLTKLLTLDISGNSLNDIPIGALKTLNSLTDISMEKNQFKSIAPESFSGMKSLESIDLSENPIEKIETNAFSNENLQTLRIGFCQISTLMPRAFSGLPKLSQLTMVSNRIANLAGSGIEQLSNLRLLDVSINQLGSLPDNFFDLLPNINQVIFAMNNMTDFPVSSLANAMEGRKLLQLDLSFNPLNCSLKAKIESAVNVAVLKFPFDCVPDIVNASAMLMSSSFNFLTALSFLYLWVKLLQ